MVNRKFVDLTSRTKDEEVETDNKGLEAVETEVHHVPFKVEYEGPAKVDIMFTGKSVTSSGDSKVLINQFRGRPLHGQELKLPKNFEGLVASDLKRSSSDIDESTSSEGAEISLVKRFDSMTYWNWDKVPSGMDKHIKLLDWLELSEVLHEPIQNSTN